MSQMFLELFVQIQTATFQAMERARDEERGQGLVEYVGAIALVGLIFVALSKFAPGFADGLKGGIEKAITKVSP